MIVLKPCGGLCNRLRAVDAALVLSRQINQPLKVLWTLSEELNCGWHALFEPSDRLEVIDISPTWSPSSGLLKRICFIRDYAIARLTYRCAIFQSQITRLMQQRYDFTQLRNYASIYIVCCSRFYRIELRYQPFVAIPPIRSLVDSYKTRFSPHTVGVHIRRTDHCTVSPYSPEEGFIEAMEAEIQRHPNTMFFLASDSPEIMSRFSRLFGDRIIQHPKEYNRNTPQGIQDALVDLLCLSQTQKIIGTYMSSFSGTAAQMNDIPLIAMGEPK